MTNYFITTAIPYINANAHVGHAQEFLLADTLARFYRTRGQTALLQSGTDDNSLKNVDSARRLGQPLDHYLQAQGQKFRDLLDKLAINPDFFIRTSSPEHIQGVQYFIQSLDPTDLQEGTYSGLYCRGCEDFLKAKDLVQGLCPDHKKAPETIEETNIFFRLSRYQQQIKELIEQDIVKITPRWRKEEILAFLENGLEDISISRPNNEAIGVPFPGKPGQSVYVWIDALVNYLTGAGYPHKKYQSVWHEDVYKIHVIGKNVWKFHALYWVGLLLSAKLPLPNEIFIHGFLTINGEKISKSTGNAIDPETLLPELDADVLRCYLLGKLSFEHDSDFNTAGLKTFYQEELLNQVGNLFPRLQALSAKFRHPLKVGSAPTYPEKLSDLWALVLTKTWALNKEINDSQIWALTNRKQIQSFLDNWGPRLFEIRSLLTPLLPLREDLLTKVGQERVLLFKKLTPTEST